VVGPGTNCTTPLLGEAQPFGTFLVGRSNATTTNDLAAVNGMFGGRVAVNGSALLSGYAIGLGLNCSQLSGAELFTLIVAGDLNATNGRLECGTFVVGGQVLSAPELSATAAAGQTGNVTAIAGLDFQAASLDLESVSLALCAQTTNSTAAIVEAFGMISFNQTEQRFTTGVNGSSVPVANVFTINASALATANQVTPSLCFLTPMMFTQRTQH
jgi:choice-of-anchor A domain-containing protein